MNKNKKIESFLDHFPPKVAEYCFNLWNELSFEFIVSKKRDSKLGDFRFAPNKGFQITVNHNLNPYAFLVTYLHEVAHLITYQKHKNAVNPHGQEWKDAFLEVFDPLLDPELLPSDVVKVLKAYLLNPVATSNGYTPLVEVLKKYDPAEEAVLLLFNLPEGTIFQLKNLRLQKGKLRRTRYICQEVHTGKLYLVAKNAHVQLIEMQA
ncbi:SprT-like domain-containing protein [Aquirufa sp.]|uniref:SprT-like domain-containing protein n=1 Tax=Aquirufa sp. TaxID=2676249 RepID=UPI0037BFE0B4